MKTLWAQAIDDAVSKTRANIGRFGERFPMSAGMAEHIFERQYGLDRRLLERHLVALL